MMSYLASSEDKLFEGMSGNLSVDFPFLFSFVERFGIYDIYINIYIWLCLIIY